MKDRKNTYQAAFVGAALVAWIMLGSYWYNTNCCSDWEVASSEDIAQYGRLVIHDGALFKVESPQNILFALNESKPEIAAEVSDNLFKTISYIKSNPLKKIVITGYYGSEEIAPKDLSKNRAMALQKLFLDAATPSYQVEIRTKEKINLLRDRSHLIGMVRLQIAALSPIKAVDNLNDLEVIFNTNLAFKTSSVHFLMPIGDISKTKLKEIAAYLENRPSRKLVLNGYYLPSEKNTSGFPNLGLVRANKIKSILVGLGAPARQIVTKGLVNPKLETISSPLYGDFLLQSIAFVFEDVTTAYIDFWENENRRLDRLFRKKKSYRFDDFELEEMKIVKEESLRKYLQDLHYYMSLHPQALLYSIGHSNQTEDITFNYRTAHERATYVKNFLVENGFEEAKIIVQSLGATAPLGSDNSRKGQYLNRRVDLYLSPTGKAPKVSSRRQQKTAASVKNKKKNRKLKSEAKKATKKEGTERKNNSDISTQKKEVEETKEEISIQKDTL